jgi:hypothetical protein
MIRSGFGAGAWLAVAVAAVGCGTCSPGRPTRNAEEFLPPDSVGALSVPSLGKLADGAQGLLATARAGAGGAQVVKAAADLTRMLGFDPLNREGLKAAGLEPDASMAAGGTANLPVAALPVGDKARLEATITRLAADRFALTKRRSKSVDGVDVSTLSPENSDVPDFAWTLKEGFALVSIGPNCVQAVAAAAGRKAEESLAKVGALAAGRAKIGARELYAFALKDSLPAALRTSELLVVGVGVTATEVSGRAFVALPETRAKAVAAVLVGGGGDSLAHQPAAAPLHLRAGVDWAALARESGASTSGAESLAELRERLAAVGVELDGDLLANLEPGFSLTLGLAPTANLGRALNFDPRRGNPLSSWSLLALGSVKDAAKAAVVLPKAAPLVAGEGLTLREREVAGAKTWAVTGPDGSDRLAWGLKGKELVLAGESAAVEAYFAGSAAAAAIKPEQFEPRARDALFGKQGAALGMDFAKLADSVRALPTSAFGTGPGGMMARSMTTTVIQPLSRLKAVAAVAPSEGGVTIDLAINAK